MTVTEPPALPAFHRAAAPHRESALLLMSDIHHGKETNFDQTAARFTKIGERLAARRDDLPAYAFDELIVAYLGDGPDGSGIYPGQSHHQAVSDARQQATELADILTAFLIQQQRHVNWGSIRVEGIAGNHGRSSKHNAEGENYDILTLDLLARQCREHVPINYNPKDPFLRKIMLRGPHAGLLYHGHGLRSIAATTGRIKSWATSALYPFSLVALGHLHTTEYYRVNTIHFLRSGTMVRDDGYAAQLGYQSVNEWWLCGLGTERALTWQFRIDLT